MERADRNISYSQIGLPRRTVLKGLGFGLSVLAINGCDAPVSILPPINTLVPRSDERDDKSVKELLLESGITGVLINIIQEGNIRNKKPPFPFRADECEVIVRSVRHVISPEGPSPLRDYYLMYLDPPNVQKAIDCQGSNCRLGFEFAKPIQQEPQPSTYKFTADFTPQQYELLDYVVTRPVKRPL